MPSRRIVVAGAGIAGLTAAIAFARHGFGVRVFERSPVLEEVGAGLQLSPNATRILDRLGVLDLVSPSTVRPEAVVLRDAATLSERARVPLGAAAERRWKAPYLVAHRADLQSALLARATESPLIEVLTDATVSGVEAQSGGNRITLTQAGIVSHEQAALLVAADGVWSTSRRLVGPNEKSRFTGELAWRTTLSADGDVGRHFASLSSPAMVTTYLHSGFHLVAYPIRAGTAINLAAFTPGNSIAEQWSGETDAGALKRAMRGTAPGLSRLIEDAGPWTVWPLHAVDQSRPWTAPSGIALIGDAAHAMTPFAAQGAAMAIEDAFTLADAIAAAKNTADGLSQWETLRKPRVRKVARRGALNRLAWHASGPVALGRNMFLKFKSPESLAADMDWLYGWTPPGWTDDGRL
ncbi:FAD-dependent monooxygenase [Aminobacter aganoensis]|uniref:Salicylate hydroxylase n=1 Tax=Aminobacter aganoensis TaxID=83264 RepID=A0A7X0F4Z2_9HYPH|nr:MULTISPECIES: FAD-dependent monooxygenase [Aminobacter]KQU65761.1 salicylate hydroxylase [Aminobacter sp. DSM 101952]MBB6353184.1 salicylate hydroxylase [Aminobacter aganoensis]